MTKHLRHKIFSAFTVVCLCLTSPLFLARNSWAQQSPKSETALLERQLKSQDVKQRLDALRDLENYLGNRDPDIVLSAQPAVLPLIATVKDPNKDVRVEAAIALGMSGVPAKLSVPVLIAALKDPKKDVRKQAAITLGWILDPSQGAAIPALKHEDFDTKMREEAVNALISAATKDSDESVQQEAISSLRNMGALPEELRLKDNSFGCGVSFTTIK